MAQISSLVLMTFFTLVLAEDQQQKDDPFTFDYHQLCVGGLIMAAVLCLIGITILLSGHCRCKFNQEKRRRTGSNAANQQMLNDTAQASDC
ncbi:FXYD domain-containing ion transport regulator 3-like [Ictalurus punctatus]|uniref:FXYD domain-containing ion transport regulator n=1 Tax=Ictalurus punctatus TaxID=7998 RepID=A0A979FB84_ICTPU|nr:FXYD domain-containing ion transport regulator 3-like [Ictalurus punctatus]